MKKINVKSKNYDKENKELNEIFAPLLSLDPSKIQIFIHGSWADNTKTSFSDLDDFIIVDDEYYNKIKKRLDEVEFNFQKRDPIQHHGHWLIKRSELNEYDNSYMPLFIMNEAICLLGDNQIIANVNESQVIDKTVRRIQNTCKNIELFYQKKKSGLLNVYDLKRFVGSIALLSPLIFQIKGNAINKRDAILTSNLIYSDYALKLIQWSTDLRNNWNEIVEANTFINFSRKLKKFNNANEWRKYALLNSPVLDFGSLSDVLLTDDLIETFIRETLNYVDEVKYQTKEVENYEIAFQKVKDYSIDCNAIIVGQFGSIKYPSISDLDVFICFEDEEYDKGCKKIDDFIKSDESLSYLFTHSPLYVCKSMLNDIKYLHTLYDLKIVYNPLDLTIDKKLSESYQSFLNMVWSYLITNTTNSISETIKFHDIRKLLLSLKNAQTSVFNIEKSLKGESEELKINHNTRVTVLKEGLKARKLVESEYFRVHLKLKELLKELDADTTIARKKISILNKKYVSSDETFIKNDTVYLNPVFFNLIYNIHRKKDENSIIYINTIRKNFKLYKKYGVYIKKYIWVVPYKYITLSLNKKIKLITKSIVKSILSNLHIKYYD